jgi:hypothetical protein
MTNRGTRVFWQTPPHHNGQANGHSGGQVALRRADMPPPDFAAAGAPCTRPNVDPELFHPVGDTSNVEAQVTFTIATYCLPCPMRAACEAWGRRVGRGTGIWGGVWLDRLPRRPRRTA